MMALLTRKLDAQAMAKRRRDRSWRESAAAVAPGGKFAEAVAHAHITDGNAAEFIQWWLTGYLQGNGAAMQRAHPEHLGTLQLPGELVGIVEVVGHGGPSLSRARRIEDWASVLVQLQPDMPHRFEARIEDGQVLGYSVHQFRDNNPGSIRAWGVLARWCVRRDGQGRCRRPDGRVLELVRNVPADS